MLCPNRDNDQSIMRGGGGREREKERGRKILVNDEGEGGTFT
jgi:hypothetical protein